MKRGRVTPTSGCRATSPCFGILSDAATSHDLALLTAVRLLQRFALGLDCAHQILPRVDEGLGPLSLQIGAQLFHVDSDPSKLGQHLFAIRAVTGNSAFYLTVLAERE